MSAIEVDELPIPEAVGAAGWDDFVAGIRVQHRADAKWFATTERATSPEDELAHVRDPYRPAALVIAREGDRVVGFGSVIFQAGEDETAWAYATTDPDHEGRGIGRGLMDAVEDAVRRHGRRKVIAYVPENDLGGERRIPPTGGGSIPEHSRTTRFMDARGYRLEQVNRLSRLALPVEGIAERLAAAVERSGPDFRLHRWVGPTPERWLNGMAELFTRMSTDPPDGGVGTPEDVWDAARVVAEGERLQRENPSTFVVTAVEHVPSGVLAGFTDMAVPPELPRGVHQWSTIVLEEHRGHRLGMLLKLANLAHLQEVAPGHPSVLTFNAEENRPMLDVNEALGFVQISYEGLWRLDL